MRRSATLAIVLLTFAGLLQSQELRRRYVDQPTLVTSQLGFRERGPKTVTLLPSPRDSSLPDEIPFDVDRLLFKNEARATLAESLDRRILRLALRH